jgi:hypothetical protein
MSGYGTKRTSRSRIVPAEVRSAGDIGQVYETLSAAASPTFGKTASITSATGARQFDMLRRWGRADHTAHEHPTGI